MFARSGFVCTILWVVRVLCWFVCSAVLVVSWRFVLVSGGPLRRRLGAHRRLGLPEIPFVGLGRIPMFARSGFVCTILWVVRVLCWFVCSAVLVVSWRFVLVSGGPLRRRLGAHRRLGLPE